MQKITPHLWFDKEAKEAAAFYTSLFPNSKITNTTQLRDTPSGDTDIVTFELDGYRFMAISAGPFFKFNPSVSFMLNYDSSKIKDAEQKLKDVWEKLADGGEALMPLQQYPFSKLYGWVQDKYGVSWQLILSDSSGDERPFIIPSLMFVGDVCGKAEEATDFYISVFKHAKRGVVSRYAEGQEPDKAGTINHTDFTLENQWFAAMDSAQMHGFTFNEAVSLIVNCDNQEEVDYYWEKLSAAPEAEQCGWLKDKYGVSWQVVPKQMDEMMQNGTPEQIGRVTKAFLQMKKFDIGALQKAFEGK